MSTAKKLDIFAVLGKLNTKTGQYYDSLTPEEQKTIAPFVLQRWATGTTNAFQVYSVNEFVNPYVFTLQHHKGLLWRLLVAANAGVNQRYQWTKALTKPHESKPVAIAIIRDTHGYSTRDAIDTLGLFSYDDLLAMAIDLGYQQDDLDKLAKEFGIKKSKRTKKTKDVASQLMDF